MAENFGTKHISSSIPSLAGGRMNDGIDTTDDVVIDLATKGLVLKDTQSPAHYWRVGVTILGLLVTTDLGTTKP